MKIVGIYWDKVILGYLLQKWDMHVEDEISLFDLIKYFKFEHNLRYPKITLDAMVYASFSTGY